MNHASLTAANGMPALSTKNLNLNSAQKFLVSYEVATVRDYDRFQGRNKRHESPLKAMANDFMLPPSGRLGANSLGLDGDISALDNQIRGMRPPGYRASQGNNGFNMGSQANLSQDTGFGQQTQIGSSALNFGIQPARGD